jgi:very-short-patch-repair endonuclease
MRNPRITALAHQQDGLITRQQALAAGASASAIRHAVRSGRWQVAVRGIYATFAGPLGRIHRLRVAILHSGPESVITGATACAMINLRYVPFGYDGVDTLVAEHRRPRDTAFIRVNRTSRLPEPVWWIDTTSPGANADHDAAPPWWVPGDPLAPSARRWTIPMAPAARAAIDAVRFHCLQTAAAADLDAFRRHQLLRDVRALLCEVVQRRHCSVDDLLNELAAAPQRGSALANRALEDVIAGCRSTAECDLRDFIRSCRFLPEPRWNQPLPGFSKVVPDACWPEARLVVEVDSVEWHQFGDAPEKTARRHALYAALGWRVFPVSPHRLRTDAVQVRRELVTAYRSGLAQA